MIFPEIKVFQPSTFEDYRGELYTLLSSTNKDILEKSKNIEKLNELSINISDEVSKITGELAGYGINEDLVAGIVPVSLGIQESLWLMSSARGGICANSTFSWIAAYGCKGDGPLFIPACWSTRHPDFVFTAPWLRVL